MGTTATDSEVDVLNRPGVLSPLVMARLTGSGVVVPWPDVEPNIMIEVGPWRTSPERVAAVGRAELELLSELAAGEPLAPIVAVDAVIDRLGLPAAAAAELRRFVEAMAGHGLLGGPDESTTAVRRPRPGSSPATLAPPQAGTSRWAANTPVALPLGADGRFVVLDHDGWVVESLSPLEVLAVSAFRGGVAVGHAAEALVGMPGVGPDEVAALDLEAQVERFARAGLVRAGGPDAAIFQAAVARQLKVQADGDQKLVEAFDEVREHQRTTGVVLPVVVGVDIDFIPMLSLGMVVGYAKAFEDGALQERLAFAPLWHTSRERFDAVVRDLPQWPSVFLFSHYIWNAEANLGFAAALKAARPDAITVHGGPSVPKYEGDAAAYLAAHPQVDIMVRGEGEATLAHVLAALADRWPGSPDDLSGLRDVEGITFRLGDEIVRTPDRGRIEDLDTIPSPYLTGMFDHVDRFHVPAMVLETNRGCPYGCTFCDWGSATLSRVRKFDLDRVMAEMAWSAERGIEAIYTADANYGLLDRDLDIVRYAVELKKQHGVPKVFNTTFAKNRVKNLAEIVRIVADGGIEMLSVASVQSFDKSVLDTVHRSNIKQERYDALIGEFRRNGFPLYTDVMIGLPGSTLATTKADFQAALDRELHVKANPTALLMNSPMNSPEYRAEQGIVAVPGEFVSQSKSFTHDEWVEMMELRRLLSLAERCGLLRQVATYARAEVGMREIDFYDLVRTVGTDRRRWPHLSYLVAVAPDEFIPPGSWWPVVEDVGRLMVDEVGVADDAALRTVLGVQHALLPARGRVFPLELDLDHDYAAWHDAVLDAKLVDARSWPAAVAPLRSFGPASFVVRDDDDVCSRVTGMDTQGAQGELVWELDSPVMRPKHRTLGDLVDG